MSLFKGKWEGLDFTIHTQAQLLISVRIFLTPGVRSFGASFNVPHRLKRAIVHHQSFSSLWGLFQNNAWNSLQFTTPAAASELGFSAAWCRDKSSGCSARWRWWPTLYENRSEDGTDNEPCSMLCFFVHRTENTARRLTRDKRKPSKTVNMTALAGFIALTSRISV